MKKLVSILLAITLVLTNFQGWNFLKELDLSKEINLFQGLEKSFAETGTLLEGTGIYYTIKNNTITITDCLNSESGKLVIPSTIDGKPVTSIGKLAFNNCRSLTEIIIPESVTIIDEYAFYSCESLTEIIIPDGVTTIGSYAFAFCRSLTKINIPRNITIMGSYAFEDCDKLTEVIISEGSTFIGQGAFSNCDSLTKVTIPKSVTTIKSEAFYDCDSLTQINIPEGVTTIKSRAFNSCNLLTQINIPESIITIGIGAFSYCISLTEINIPESITTIESNLFTGCSSLKKITIPKNVTTIKSGAFNSCSSLTEVIIPKGVTTIGNEAFYHCNRLTNITIPESVTTIGSYAFADTLLTEITIPEGVTNIQKCTFYKCNLLAKITIPEGVTTIENEAFYYCSRLKEIIIPKSVTTIGSYAFANCSNLTEITIPESVTTIGSYAFTNCSNLIIYGYSGSCAETYANKNNIPFKDIEEQKETDIQTVKETVYIKKGSEKSISAYVNKSDGTIDNDRIFIVSVKDDSIVSEKTIINEGYLISLLQGLEFGETTIKITSYKYDENAENHIGDYVSETEVKVVVNETGDSNRLPDTDKTIATMEIPNSITVSYGTKFSDLNLPTSINVTLVNGTKMKANINWDESTYTSSSGCKKVKGTFATSDAYDNNRQYEPIILVNVMKSIEEIKQSEKTNTIESGKVVEEGKVKLKNQNLVINGRYVCDSLKICEGSKLEMGEGGCLIVKGDLVIESDGIMDMSKSCRVQAKNFNIKTNYTISNFSAGDLYIEEDFKQSGNPANFQASGTHSVIFVGTKKHSISSRNNGFIFKNLYIEPSTSGAPLSNFDSLEKLNAQNVLGEYKTVSVKSSVLEYGLISDKYEYISYTKDYDIKKNMEMSKQQWFSNLLNVYKEYCEEAAYGYLNTTRLTNEEQKLIINEAKIWSATISSPLYRDLLDAGKINKVSAEFKLNTEKEGTIGVKFECDIYGYGSYSSLKHIKCTIDKLNITDATIGVATGASGENFLKQAGQFLVEEYKSYFANCTASSSDPLDIESMINKKIHDKIVDKFIDLINDNILYSNTTTEGIYSENEIKDIKTSVKVTSDLISSVSLSSNNLLKSTLNEEEAATNLIGKEDDEFSDENFVSAVKKSLDIDKYINLNADILSDVEYLDLSSSGIENISGIEYCTNLKYLDISANNISNLYYIKDLKNLKYLNISDNEVDTTYYLGNLTNLTSLDIKSNNISDLSNLEKLVNLEQLILSGNDLSTVDISNLNKLTNLKIFEARECGLSNIDTIPTNNLMQLDLSNNKIEDISILETASKLTNLFVSNNYIGDITGIKNCSEMKVLDLSYNILDSVEPLENLTSLEELNLEFCYLMNYELDSISKLVNLKELNLAKNYIYNIDLLASLTKLTKLNVSYTEVDDISNLDDSIIVTNNKKEIPIQNMSFIGDAYKIVNIGNSINLKVCKYPINSNISELSWKSSDDTIATVDSNGVVKGVTNGVATITVTDKISNLECTCKVVVKSDTSSVVMFNSDNGEDLVIKEVSKDTTLDYIPEIPVKDGYVFVGWFKDVNDITTEYKSGSTYTENVTYTAKYAHVTMLGAQVKTVVDNKSGIRFGTRIYDDGDEIVEKGTLILPANLLANGETLTLETPKAARSVGKVNYEVNEEKNYVTYLGTIINIPDSQFDTNMTASSYVIYKDKAGNEYTVYSPYKNGSTTINKLLGK